MSKMQTVSIVVPAYNEELYIGRCLDALANELEANDEIIIVDNNSSDNTATKVKQYVKNDTRIKLVKENRQGTMFARKTGFDLAKGKYIGTVDSDTIVLKGWRTGMLSGIQEQKVDAVSSYGLLDIKYLRRTNYFFTNKILFSASPFLLGARGFLFGSNMLMDKDVWHAISNQVRLERRIWDDFEITLLAQKNGKLIGTVKKPLFKFSSRRSLDSPKDIYHYTQDGRYTLRKYSRIRATLILTLIYFTIGLVIVLLKPINMLTETTKSD